MSDMENNAELKKIINSVQDYVEKNKYEFIVPEHVLIVLLDDDKCKKMITDLTTDDNKKETLDCLKKEVEKYVQENVPRVPQISSISPTLSYTKMIQTSIAQSSMRGAEPNSLNVFLALFVDTEQASTFFLAKHGITEEKLLEYMRNNRKTSVGVGENLEKYAVNLVEIARASKIDPLIGRKKEVNRIIQILSKKRVSNSILVGNAGCGKSAIIEGLALQIANGEAPKSLLGKTVYALDISSMLAGTRFRGEFEERLQNVIKEAASHPEIILAIDEIHNICGAGGSSDGSMDASNILKPYLSRGELHIIGATTYDEYKRIEKDKAFCRRFKKIDIEEPTKEETKQIMMGLKDKYEDFHNVSFSEEVIDYIVELSGRYLFDKCYPDKAIDVMDEIGAKYHSGLLDGTEVQKKDVESVICSMANIPEITVETSEKDKLKTLGERIKSNLFGNDEVIDKIVRQICMSKAGLSNKNKPVFSGLLIGGTGTGKSELAKQLAEALGVKLVRLNMSEYSEEYSTSKLIGSAAGYVGYEQSGALTEPLIQNPNSVVLLDEIEKANESVYNLLLQVMDEGQLTDNHGREASFKNAIVLMTSNVGVRESENANPPVGFVEQSENVLNDKKQEILEDELKEEFSPEFRNRLTNIFYFNPVGKETLELIVDKDIRKLNDMLSEKKVSISIDSEAKDYIVQKSMEENAGGRPVERIINSEISEKIADEILFGKLEFGGIVNVTVNDNKIALNFSLINENK